jgi:hypothetical protein
MNTNNTDDLSEVMKFMEGGIPDLDSPADDANNDDGQDDNEDQNQDQDDENQDDNDNDSQNNNNDDNNDDNADDNDDTDTFTVADDQAGDNADEDEEEDVIDADLETLKANYEFALEEGILQPNDDFEFDGTNLEEAYAQTKYNQQSDALQKVWNAIPEDFKGALEFAISGGDSLSEYYDLFHDQDDVTKLDLSKTENQRSVINRYLSETTKMSKELIKKKIDRWEDSGVLEEEATDILPELEQFQKVKQQKALESKKQAQIDAHQAELDRRSAIQSSISEASYITKPRKNKVKAFLFNEVKRGDAVDTQYNMVLNSIYKNPEHLAQLADFLLEYDEKKGLQFDRFEKRGKSKAVSSFSKRLNKRTSDTKASVKGGRSKITPDTFDFAEAMKQLE